MADPCKPRALPSPCSLHRKMNTLLWEPANKRWFPPLRALPMWRESCCKGMVTVVAGWSPAKPCRCAQHTHTHICHKLLVLKGRGQSLKDTGETGKWVDFGPHCSGVCPMNQPASLLHSRFATERRAFAEYSGGPSRRFPQVSLSWWQTHRPPTPVFLSTLRGKWFLPLSLSLASEGKEGWPTERGKGQMVMNFNQKARYWHTKYCTC